MAQDFQISGTLSLEDQMSNVLKNAINGVSQFGDKTQSAIQKATSSVESISKQMKVGGVAVTAMGVKSMKSFGDFEASLNKAAVVAGGTSKNIGELADVANKMGADLPLSAQDAADAMVSMAQDGASIDTIKEEFPAIAKAATAAGSDLQVTASVVQQAMNIWGKSLGSPAQAAATLTATANMSNASVEDMQQVLADAGGTAKQMGLSMQDLSTAVGLITNKGVPAAQAAQNLNFALTRMIKPSKQARGVMDDLGLSYFDANGNMKPFAQILQELNQKTAGLTNEQKALNLTTLFGQAGYKVVASLMDSVADTTGNATTSWSAYKSELDKVTSSEDAANNALNSQASDMQNNIGSALEQVGGNWESLRNKSEEVSKDFNINMLHMISGVLGFATDSKTAFGQVVQHLIGYSTYIGVAMTATGTFMSTVNNLVNGTSNLQKAFTALLSPQMLIAAGIASLAAIFVVAYTHSEALQQAINNIGQAFSGVFGPAIDGAKNSVGGIMKLIQQLAVEIGNHLANVLNSIDWNGAFGAALGIIQGVISMVEQMIKAFENTGTVFAVWILVKDVFSLIGQLLVGIVSGISSFISVSSGASSSQSIYESIAYAINSIIVALDNVVMAIGNFNQIMNSSGATSAIWEALRAVIYLVWTILSTVIGSITDFIGVSTGIDTTTNGFINVANAIKLVADFITNGANALTAFIKNSDSGTVSAVAFGLGIGGIVLAISKVTGFLPSFGGEVANAGKSFDSSKSKAGEFANNLLKIGTAVGIATAGIGIMAEGFANLAAQGDAGNTTITMMTTSIIAIVASLAIFGPALTANAVGIGVFGAAVSGVMLSFAAFNLSVVAVATSFNSLSSNIDNIVPVFEKVSQGITLMMTTMLQSVVVNSPLVAAAFIALGSAILQTITALAPQVGKAFVAVFGSALSAITQLAPQFSVAATAIIVAICDVIINSADKLATAGMSIVIAILKGINDNIVQITQMAINIIIKFVDTLTKNMNKLITSGVNFVVSVVKGIANNLGKIIDAGILLVSKLLIGIANRIPSIVDSGIKLVLAIIKGIGYTIGRMPGVGLQIIFEFIKGIIAGLKGSIDAGKKNANAVSSGIKAINLWKVGKGIIDGFLKGMQDAFKNVQNFVSGIAEWIKKHKGPIQYDRRLLIPAGKAIMNGLNGGLYTGFDKVKSTVQDMNNAISDSFQPNISSNAISDAVNSANRQLQTGLTANMDGNIVLTQQPAYINLNMGNGAYSGFVDDITKKQNTELDRANKYRLGR